MSAFRRFPLIVLCSLLLAGVALGESLPRYSLPVGRKLTYSIESSSKSSGEGGGNDMSTAGTWQITVVRENPDGSRRVILRSASSFTQSFNGQKNTQPERVQLAYADIFPDGRVLPNPSLGMHMDPAAAIPPLPKDNDQASKGWSHENSVKMETTTYAPKTGGEEFVFTAVTDGVMNKIYQTASTTTYHFDPKRGTIASSENEQSQDYGFHNKGTGSLKLESDQTIPADEAAKLGTDFDALFAAREQYNEKMKAVQNDPAQADTLIADARSLIEKARDAAGSETVKGELDKMLKDHDQYGEYARKSADRFKEVLNKPSPDWETTDIDGKPAKLADYKGKVVVMDFWYRGCGWCMYAMPQVKQLADDFSAKPVVVLGMNTDRDEKDARLVIDTMALKHPTIKAEGIPPKYGVQGFPTLIIIDQEGVVRDVHVGYSPTLHDDVAKKINELLAKPAKPAA